MAGTRRLQNWCPQTHEAILIALVDHVKPAPGDWAGVMAALHAQDFTFTESALKYVCWLSGTGWVSFLALPYRVEPLVFTRFPSTLSQSSQPPPLTYPIISHILFRLLLPTLHLISLLHLSTMPATVWDGAAHLCLLQAVFDSVSFTLEEWDKILKFTRDRGYEYTSGAAVYILPFSSSSHPIFPKTTTPPHVRSALISFPLSSHQSQPQSVTRSVS
ncbi:hypothetical protein GE09DRAFT_38380 [Coniochaeta sp. 2T2.1]|nr:hypothetical protein GE09DRAFT_38380 [Coniochaeta sp. 2T2.1]